MRCSRVGLTAHAVSQDLNRNSEKVKQLAEAKDTTASQVMSTWITPDERNRISQIPNIKQRAQPATHLVELGRAKTPMLLEQQVRCRGVQAKKMG